MTYYGLLGIPENADSEAIHGAYRTRARQYHPDAGEGSSAGKFREVVEAYETLADPVRRQAYDRKLARDRRPVTPVEVVVEPLAQPWFSRPTHNMNAWPSARVSITDELFVEVLLSAAELLINVW